MGRPVKTLLVGISGYGTAYVRALLSEQADGHCDLVGVADPVPQACPLIDDLRQRQIPIMPSLSDALARWPDVELVMLSTPIHLHAPQTCEALEYGTNVLCEKPLAGSVRDGLRILRAAEAAEDRFVAIGYQWSFSRAIQALKRDVATGVLGRPRRLRSWVAFPRPESYFRRNRWAGRARADDGADVADSPVNNATSHYLHNMFYVLAPTRERSAIPRSVQAELYRANDIETYDTAAIRCQMEDDVEVMFYTSHATPDWQIRSIMEFEHATVVYEPTGSAREFIAYHHDGRVTSYGNPEQDRDAKIWQCVDGVRSGEPVACGPAAALAQTLCMSSANRSAGQVVTVPDSSIRRFETDQGPQLCVDHLDALLDECFSRGLLPSEVDGLPWTRPSRVVLVEAGEELK